jgi:hypothetical protein
MIKCSWPECGGWIYEGFCVKCGRTPNLIYEIGVTRAQREHDLSGFNWGSGMVDPDHPQFTRDYPPTRKSRIRSGANKRKVKIIKVKKKNARTGINRLEGDR